eukprot:Opistho-1_new@93416
MKADGHANRRGERARRQLNNNARASVLGVLERRPIVVLRQHLHELVHPGPPLFLRTAVLEVRLLHEVDQRLELNVRATQPGNHGRVLRRRPHNAAVLRGRSVRLLAQLRDAHRCQLHAADAVERARRQALLEVAKHVDARREIVLPLSLQNVVDDLRRVRVLRLLVPEHHPARRPLLETGHEEQNVLLELVERDALLGRVANLGARRKRAQRRKVAAKAAVRLHHKHAPTRRRRRLLQHVDATHNVVQRRVASDAELRPGHVVADRRGKERHGHAKLAVLVARPHQLEEAGVCLKAADRDHALNLLAAHVGGDRVETRRRGLRAVRAELGAALVHPRVDAGPRHLVQLAGREPLKAVLHAVDCVARVDADPDGGARGRVHARRGGAAVQQEKVERLLPVEGERVGALDAVDALENLKVLLEVIAAEVHRAVVVARLDGLRHFLRHLDRLNKVDVNRLRPANANDDGVGRGVRVEHRARGSLTHHRRKDAVEGRGVSAALHVAEDSDACVVVEALLEHRAHVVRRDWIALAVARALAHNHNAHALALLAALANLCAHDRLPVVDIRGALGDEHPVGAARDRRHQRKETAVAAHDFQHERALVARRRALDRVDGLDDAVHRRVGADGDVRPAHVVVDRSHKTDDVEIADNVSLLLCDLPGREKLLDVTAPLLLEEVRASEASVATDHNQAVDAVLDEVLGGNQAPRPLAKCLATGRPNHSATLAEDAGCVLPVHLADEIAAIDHALVSLVDSIRVHVVVHGNTHNGANGSIHAYTRRKRGQSRLQTGEHPICRMYRAHLRRW